MYKQSLLLVILLVLHSATQAMHRAFLKSGQSMKRIGQQTRSLSGAEFIPAAQIAADALNFCILCKAYSMQEKDPRINGYGSAAGFTITAILLPLIGPIGNYGALMSTICNGTNCFDMHVQRQKLIRDDELEIQRKAQELKMQEELRKTYAADFQKSRNKICDLHCFKDVIK